MTNRLVSAALSVGTSSGAGRAAGSIFQAFSLSSFSSWLRSQVESRVSNFNYGVIVPSRSNGRQIVLRSRGRDILSEDHRPKCRNTSNQDPRGHLCHDENQGVSQAVAEIISWTQFGLDTAAQIDTGRSVSGQHFVWGEAREERGRLTESRLRKMQ
jgi:hypothetical protein